MKLQSRPKNAYGRCVLPAETVRHLKSLLRSRYDFWMHEETVAPYLHWSALFVDEMGFRAMGKGVDAIQSRAGALAEAAEWLATRPLEKLPGYRVAHQDDLECPLRVEDLLRHIANATPPVLARIKAVPAARHWVDGFSLMNDQRWQVPLDYIRRIHGPNGKAAGNCLEEAIVHASMEVFERRAHITVLRNRMVVPTIMPETIPCPVIQSQLVFLRRQGIEFTIKDLSFDEALPCIGAYFRDGGLPDTCQFHHSFKVGASFNRIEALQRVFTEYVQGRRADEFGPQSPAGLKRLLEPDFRALPTQGGDCDNFLSSFMFGFVPWRDAAFLESGPRIPFVPAAGYTDCLDDIAGVRRICERLDLDYIVVDLSDPAAQFAVTQVIMPGYSDVLPFHPPTSPVLFRNIGRDDVLAGYPAPAKKTHKS